MRKTLLLLALLSACRATPNVVAQTDNAEVSVDLLFTHDGCRVYRFLDGDMHYFVRCAPGESVDTLNTIRRSTGKSSYTVPDYIPTR